MLEIWNWLAGHASALGLDVLLTALLMYPLVDYLRYGWVRKKEEIESCMSGVAKLTYFNVWLDNKGDRVHEKNADKEFADYYLGRYGRMRFFWPIVFMLPIALAGNLIVAEALIELTSKTEIGALHVPAAAIAGAYTFVTWDFFARVQRRALGTSDVLRGALRLVMALPLGFAFAAITPDGSGWPVFVAYGIGVFPVDDLRVIVRRLVSDKLKLPQDDGKAADPITNLSGVDNDTADRLADADVATIPQLAWSDPIQLIMRTNLSFDYVIDIVSQALAWSYLGEDLRKLRRFGLRGAYEMHALRAGLNSENEVTVGKAKSVLVDAAKDIGLADTGLLNVVEQIAKDKATEFLCQAS